MNLSKNNLDLSRAPLKTGGCTPESARLLPLLGGLTGGGAGALVAAPMYSKPLVSVSMGAVAAMRNGGGVVVIGSACTTWRASLNWVSVLVQCPRLNSLSLSIWSSSRDIQKSP